jgi:hypothetical protein
MPEKQYRWLEVKLTRAPYRLPVYLACLLLAVASNYLIGKEMAFDLLNYHLYAGFNALNDRFGQDYFAAGPQSYFNPYAYLPFYALVSTGLPALAIASLLAAVHSVILWLTFELALAIYPSDSERTRAAAGICAASLAYMNPVLIQQLGSSFADITTAELVLAGWVLLAGVLRTPRTAPVVWAGFILGVAVALKLTNAVHAIAALALVVFLPVPVSGRLKFVFTYCASVAIGFALFAAAWSYRLERLFANPFFPMANNVFRSPDFTTAPLRHFRFIPDTFGEALLRPFAMLDPMQMVHSELRSPDLRYAAIVILLAFLLLRWLRQRMLKGGAPAKPIGSSRELVAVGFGLAADWAIWLYSSGNSRYFIPMACVAAALIVSLLFRLFSSIPQARNYILAAIFGVQALQLWMGTVYRWDPQPWGGPWLDVTIPARLHNEPSLYLTIGMQSNSFIAPYLAPGSGLINFSGSYALGPEGANGRRISALIDRYAPRVRVLIRGAKVYEHDEGGEPRRAQIDSALERFGLRIDTSDCETIAMHGPPSYLLSCLVVHDDPDRATRIAQQRAADVVLDRLEDACPKLFQPRRPFTEHRGGSWIRYYGNTDLWAWVSQGGVKFYQSQRGSFRTYVGLESDWAKAPLRVFCFRQDGVYNAKVLESSTKP